MGLAKQGQPPLPSPAHRAAQVPYPAVSHPDNRVPASSDTIAPPTSQHPAQVAVPPVARPSNRVSLRPPKQALSVQTDFPELFMPKPSPPSAGGKKAAASVSPKGQMLKSVSLQFSSAGKSFAPKELPPKAHSQAQVFELVRSRFREALAVALGVDSEQQSAGNVSPLGSAIAPAFQDAGKDDDDNVTEVAASRSQHGDMLFSSLRSDMGMKVRDAVQQKTEHVSLGDRVSGNGSVDLDDLLQYHGVYWATETVGGPSESMPQPNPKRARMSDVHDGIDLSPIRTESKRAIAADEATREKEVRIHKVQSLAFGIEVELFKLFGGVNKKYKEKGRSLLFNLKDKNNPVLRERVLSGDITPICLCAMTIEELASKELSEWRMAKAEELANMAVLPDREVDVRRLVRKTHKGEFQVEVDETDVTEVGPGGAFAETCHSDTSSSFEYRANEKSDLMQEPKPMIDDLQVTKNLPQIMSLDELMQILHSEPHSEDQSKLESPINKSVSFLDPVVQPKGDVILKYPPEKVDAEKPDNVHGSIPESTMQCKITPAAELTHGSIWEGTIQLSLTSLTNIVAIFKSGEKPSTNEWRRFLEIKGRMKLAVLKEFLEQLPKSKSRAIMVTRLCRKEGSLKSGWNHLLQTIDSYIADERVGLLKPAEGVELYLCPQGKATQILADHLPKEHSGSLTVTETSIIGLFIWRRPHVAPRVPNRQDVHKTPATISSSVLPMISQPPSPSSNACRSHQDVTICSSVLPRISQPPSRSSSACRSHQDVAISSSVLPRISQPPSRSSSASRSHQDVATADVLPGLSPGVVKGDDDPSDNLVSLSNSAANVTSESNKSHHHTSISEDRVREIIRKYGGDNRPVAAQPWNDDADELVRMVRKYGNIPEWNRHSQSFHQQAQIPQPQFPYQEQLHYHSMLQYDMAREFEGPLPWEYTQHHHAAMPVQHPLPYGHLMQPAHQSYYGVPDGSLSWPSNFGARDFSGIHGAGYQEGVARNPWYW